MKRFQWTAFAGAALCFLTCATPSVASLVSIDEDFVVVGNYNNNVTDFVFRIDSNAATGNFVACIGTEVSNVNEGTRYNIDCYIYDSDGNRISNVLLSTLGTLSTTGTSYSIDLTDLDVGITDDDDLYVLWTDSEAAYVQAFDADENSLFDAVEIDPAFDTWLNVSVAVTENSFWVVGSSKTTTNVVNDLVDTAAFYFDSLGTQQDTFTLASHQATTLLSDDCTLSDIASSASGDLIITWIEPVDRGDSSCSGSVYAQTYRESGSAISDATQLSDEVDDDDGNDASNFYVPKATAYEDGEYVVAWTDGDTVYSANLFLDGDLADSQETLISGNNPRLGGNSATEDYVVTSELTSDGSCTIEARIAFDQDVDPETIFSPGDCNQGNDITFAADGNLLLLQAGALENNIGLLYVSKIGLPAEIEVNSVSVQEGDQEDGINNVAIIDVSLTRPHPAGDDITVSYFTRDSTALVGIDYTLTQGTLTFSGADAETTQSFEVPIIGDTVFEDDEIFEVNLENEVNAVLKNEGDSANVIILDDDTTPDIVANCDDDNANNCREIEEPGISGTSTELIVSLVMNGTVNSDISVDFETVDGTATAGEDYLANSGTLQFPAGSTTTQFAVTILGDDISEDTETFSVELSAADTVSLPDSTLTFRIINETLCDLDLDPDPNDVVVTSAGGTETFTVNSSLADCDWEVTTEDIGDGTDWITLNTNSGTGSGSVEFVVDAFDPPTGSALARNVNINVSLSASNEPLVSQTLTFEVGQDGDCIFTIDSDSASFDVDGGTGSFTVTPNDESCEWSATSNEDWLTIDSPSGIATGTGSVAYTVLDNAGETNVENAARSMTIISEEFSYTIDQNGCTYSLDSNSLDAEASDGSATVEVFAPTDATGECAWTAVSNSSWILISDGASGSGGGTVSLAILDNASVDSRTGSVTIGDETLTVNQAGQDCDYSVDTDSFSICPDGDSFDIDITATDGCSWSLESMQDWTEVLSNVTGSGSATSSGVVLDNLSESDRSGSIELRSSVEDTVAATIDFVQDGFLVYEPFDAGLPDDWVFDPSGSWSVSDSQLFGFSLNAGIATALDLSNACSNCLIESTVTLSTATNASMDALSLIGWSVSDDNQVLLSMDEFNNVWRLTQIAGGVSTSVESDSISIVPGIAYDIALGFDGVDFFAEVDGERVATLLSSNSEPSGFAGFQINNNNAIFTELRVTGSASDADVVFSSGFEALDPLEISVCTL